MPLWQLYKQLYTSTSGKHKYINFSIIIICISVSDSRKRLFSLPPKFSRLGIQGPASHFVLCVFYVGCLVVFSSVFLAIKHVVCEATPTKVSGCYLDASTFSRPFWGVQDLGCVDSYYIEYTRPLLRG